MTHYRFFSFVHEVSRGRNSLPSEHLRRSRTRHSYRTCTRKARRRTSRLQWVPLTRYLQNRSTNARPRGARCPMSGIRRRTACNGNTCMNKQARVTSSNCVGRTRRQRNSIQCSKEWNCLRCLSISKLRLCCLVRWNQRDWLFFCFRLLVIAMGVHDFMNEFL